MTLEEIAIKYKTAKVPHGFMPIYEKFFGWMKNDEIVLVEIGVAAGASMRTWSEYFPNAKIIGLEKADIHLSQIERVSILKCDAANKSDVNSAIDYYKCADIIIDDGSHRASEQLSAFNYLWESLKPGGWYVLEDLFTLYDEEWNSSSEWTIIDEVYSRMKSILTQGDSIQEVHFYGRNSINGILFIRKRHETLREQPLEEFNM